MMIIEAEHRNQRAIFLQLLAESDNFIEAPKAGQFEKWRLNDEVMWETNPRLVIVHVSGFGAAISASGLKKYLFYKPEGLEIDFGKALSVNLYKFKRADRQNLPSSQRKI